ncbi:MAG: 3-oxoacyl-ACP reductase FabG [Alicyclobacillus sp.]|nr:3-oxoacyl-ACP reductase FabG [Alicyclobacillus sp.]
MRLLDKVAIVTGAAQGIGRVFARRLAAEGASVVIADINEEKAQAVAQELGGSSVDVWAVRVDVGSAESTRAMAQAVAARYGRIDILVNNAAVFSTIKMKPFYELSEEEWDALMRVNLKGVFLASRSVFPYMKERGGRIVNMSSATVLEGRPNYLHYVSSKAGVVGFTRAAARELGPFNITVNAIAPGPTYTEIPRETVTEAQKLHMLHAQAIKKLATPDDIAGALVFLCSDEASFITGQLLTVDGGMNMH